MVDNNQKIFVSQKAIIFDDNGRILTIRRGPTAPSRPLEWDLPGGVLDWGEDTKDGIIREIKEETGLDIDNLAVIDAVSKVSSKGEFWLTICYQAKTKSANVILSFEHDDFRWVTPAGFLDLQPSGKNTKFVVNFQNLKNIDKN